jgi:hypothetical protein
MTIPTRLYVVQMADNSKPPRLVRATLRTHAERYVAGSLVRSRIASKDDIERLLSQGVRTEQATEPPREPPEPEPQAA